MHLTQVFSLPDIDCASCVNHIERDVKPLKGVHHIIVNFATQKAEVMYDPNQISLEEIVSKIKKTGYTAIPLNNESAHSSPHKHRMPDGSLMSGEDHSAHAAAENEEEIRSKALRVIVGAILSVFILALSFAVEVQNEMVLMMLATLCILLYTGKEYYLRGIPSFILRGRPNMDTLVALGVSAAFLYSSYITLFTNSHEEYFMDAAIIATFIMLGRYLEAKAKGRASAAIKKLLELSAKAAHKVVGKKMVDVPLEKLERGDVLLVKPGEKVPVDGIIVDGFATLNESMITGESIPVEKKKGDSVIGATINGNTSFRMKAEKVGKDTMLSQIIRLVEDAQMSKAPIQKLADRISSLFVWGVVLISLATFLGWYWATKDFSQALVVTVSVLIIACPCALGLATPISIVVGSGKGASLGILMKNAEALEKIHEITTICFDKTGTITKGEPEVQAFGVVGRTSEKTVLEIALSLENHSEHPLAQSIVKYGASKKIKTLPVRSFRAETGKGVTASIRSTPYSLGSISFLKSLKVDLSSVDATVEELHSKGQTVLLLADKKRVLGYFGVRDALKDTSKKAIQLLHARGIKTVMMTGDHRKVAESIAKEVGIDEVLAQVSPEQKLAQISQFQKKGEKVAMVGDGINDSPALAKADVGIAMGTGTDIAIESGEVVLVKGDLMKAVEAMALSEATLRNIKQNLFWAFAYNLVGIPVAALGFLNPMVSAGAMAFSSISVVLNALRLRRFKV